MRARGPGGQVEWLCLPRPDSPSVFGALLDRSAGVFGFFPEGVTVPSQRRYVPGTMVLETTWRTPSGWVLVHDCLSVGEWTAGGAYQVTGAHPGNSSPRRCSCGWPRASTARRM